MAYREHHDYGKPSWYWIDEQQEQKTLKLLKFFFERDDTPPSFSKRVDIQSDKWTEEKELKPFIEAIIREQDLVILWY